MIQCSSSLHQNLSKSKMNGASDICTVVLSVPWQVHVHCRHVAMQPSESVLQWLALLLDWSTAPPPIQVVAPSPFWCVYRSTSSGHLPSSVHTMSRFLWMELHFSFGAFSRVRLFESCRSSEELQMRKGVASLLIKPTLLQSF